MFENPKFAALVESGCLEMQTFESAYPNINGVRPGQILHIPQFVSAPDFTRVNLASAAARAFTAIDANDQQFPVIRDSSDMSWNRYDKLRTGEDFQSSFEKTVGNKMARRIISQACNVMSGGVPCQAPTHVADFTGLRLTVHRLLQARQLMADQAEHLSTMIIHSRVWADLLWDIINTYHFNPQIGQVIMDGNIKTLLGIDRIIITDYAHNVSAGATCAGDDTFDTYLMRGTENADGGAPALFFGYQSVPETEFFEFPVMEVSMRFIRAYLDYIIAPRGITFSAGITNPTDADLIDTTHWTSANENHRNLGVVLIHSIGMNGA